MPKKRGRETEQHTTLTDREYYIDIKTFTPDLRLK